MGFLEENKKIKDDFTLEFKVKTLTNKGARCAQAGKSNSEKIFKDLKIDQEIIDKLKKYKQIIFCNAQEIFFRYYDYINKDNKRWFFDLNESIINDLI